MGRKTTTTFELPLADGKSMGWPELREFMNALASALQAMPDGPEPEDLTEIKFVAGSFLPQISHAPRFTPAVRELRGGPNRNWPEERQRACEPFYDFVRKHGGQVNCGVHTLHPMAVPPPFRRQLYFSEMATLEGVIWKPGGEHGQVEIQFQPGGVMKCSTIDGRQTAEEMGKHMYRRVRVSGRATREVDTYKLLGFHIETWAMLPDELTAQMRRSLQDRVDAMMQDYDPSETMQLVRG